MSAFTESSLREAKRDLLARSPGIVAFPVAGALYWLGLAIGGVVLTLDTWRIVALIGTAMLVPMAILIARIFKANLFAMDHPLASLGGLPMASVGLPLFALYIVLDGATIHLLPLALAIGTGLHFPIVGWMYGSRVCAFHPLVRAVLALAVWLILPEGRFTILPLVVVAIYVVTAVLVRGDVLRARAV